MNSIFAGAAFFAILSLAAQNSVAQSVEGDFAYRGVGGGFLLDLPKGAIVEKRDTPEDFEYYEIYIDEFLKIGLYIGNRPMSIASGDVRSIGLANVRLLPKNWCSTQISEKSPQKCILLLKIGEGVSWPGYAEFSIIGRKDSDFSRAIDYLSTFRNDSASQISQGGLKSEVQHLAPQ